MRFLCSVRVQWQQKQVDKFCQKYGEDKLLYTLPNDSSSEKQIRYKLLRHLLYDDERKAVLCFIPKVSKIILPEVYTCIKICMYHYRTSEEAREDKI